MAEDTKTTPALIRPARRDRQPSRLPPRSTWLARVVVRLVGWLMILAGALFAGAAAIYGATRLTGQEVTGESIVGGLILSIAGIMMARRPYPRHPARAVLGATLIPVSLCGVLVGLSDLLFASEMRARAAELLIHPVDPDVLDWFQPTVEEAASFTTSSIRALLIMSILLGAAIVLTRTAATWSGDSPDCDS